MSDTEVNTSLRNPQSHWGAGRADLRADCYSGTRWLPQHQQTQVVVISTPDLFTGVIRENFLEEEEPRRVSSSELDGLP